jgi:hypothetical protein
MSLVSEIIPNIIISAITAGSVGGSIICLFKSWILERLKKEIEYEYAEKLKAIEFGYDNQLEKMRAHLQSESLKAQETLEHDRKIFVKLATCCNENTLKDFCITTSLDKFYKLEDWKMVNNLSLYGNQVENMFLNDCVQKEFLSFNKVLNEFLDLTSYNFFGISESIFRLYPELKHGNTQDRLTYQEACSETEKGSNEVLDAFTIFRTAVKKTLYL